MNCTHSKPTNQYPIQHHELQQQILHLHQHQKICQNSGKYLEADVAKNKLNQLKKISDVQDKRYLVDKYSEEKDIIDKAHFNEFYQFTFNLFNFLNFIYKIEIYYQFIIKLNPKSQFAYNTFWDEKMKQFNSEAKDAKDQILSRHQNELTSFLEELDHAIPLKPKDSAQLLKLRKTEQQLAKIEQYKEAHIIQQRILDLQKQEFDKWNITRQNKIKNLISQLRQKQIIELNALQQRILSVQEELSKNKSQELQIMLSKYQHIRKELENQQNQEINRLEKSIKNQSTMSKMNSQMKKTLDENYNLK